MKSNGRKVISEKKHQKLKRWKNGCGYSKRMAAGFLIRLLNFDWKFCISFFGVMFGITTVKNEDMSPA